MPVLLLGQVLLPVQALQLGHLLPHHQDQVQVPLQDLVQVLLQDLVHLPVQVHQLDPLLVLL